MNAAGILTELERHGLQVRLAGEKIAVSPKGAITEEVRQIILTNREDILALLRQAHSYAQPEAPRQPRDAMRLWPARLEGLGTKKLGALKPCLWCGVGTWVRYAGLPTCLSCARSWPAGKNPDGARAYLGKLLAVWAGMDEAAWLETNIKALYDDIMDIFLENPGKADAWFYEWRTANPGLRLL